MQISVRRSAGAIATAAAVGVWSIAGAAVADPKPGHVDHGQHLGQEKKQQHQAAGSEKHDDARDGAGAQHGRANDHGNTNGHPDDHAAAGHVDPGGNNGTVKIAGPGDEAGHPSNNPHPGCTFLVEWFGFDQGSDVVSTVSFASQAPTSDVVLGGTSPSQVFVGGDPAGGGTDLDGRQAYTLSFSGGAPHPKQGFHVKLTVATPRSHGNDTKTKVFWVQPCAGTPTGHGGGPGTPPGDDTGGPGSGDDTGGPGSVEGPGGTTPAVPDHDGSAESASATDHGVSAETASAPTGASEDQAGVPTAVEAGQDGSVLPAWARSPLPLTLIAFGLVLAGVGIAVRSRSRA